MKRYHKSLLASLLLCMPFCHMQAAAELRPNNIHQILSGIEDLQDGTRRTLDQVQELVNETIVNTNFIPVLCAMPAKERTQLLNDFNITLEEAPQEESSMTPPTEQTEPITLPDFVLEFLLKEIGFVDINGAPLCGILDLPPEMIYNMKPILPVSYRRQCEITEHRGQKLQFTKMFVSPIKNYIVAIVASEERALVFRPDGQLITQLYHKRPIRYCTTVQFLGHDEYITLWTEVDRAYYLFDIEGNHILPAGCRSYDYRGLKCVSVSPKGSYIAVNDSTDHWNRWHFYDREMQPLSLNIPSFEGYNSKYKSIFWSECEQYIYASNKYGYWDILTSTGRKIDFVLPNGEPVYCKKLKLSAHQNLVLIEDREGVMHLFDLDGNFLWTYSDSRGRPYKWCKSYQCDDSMGLFLFQRKDETCELLDRQGRTVEIKRSDTELLQPSFAKLLGEEKNILLAQTTDGLCILFNVTYEDDEVELTYHKTISFNGAALQGRVIKISQKGNYFVVQGLRGRCYLYTCNGDRVNLEQWDSRPSAYRSIQVNPTETYMLTRDQYYFTQYREMTGKILSELKADSKFEAKAQTRMVPYNHTILTYNRKHNIIYYAVVYDASIFSLSQWGMNPHQLLLLHLLAGIHSNWKKNYPRYRFMPCPADITCALLLPHIKKLASMDDEEKKTVVKQTHTWVSTILNSTKSTAQGNQTLYGYLQQKYNLQQDPEVRHLEYEENGLVAKEYLIPYVRLRRVAAINTI